MTLYQVILSKEEVDIFLHAWYTFYKTTDICVLKEFTVPVDVGQQWFGIISVTDLLDWLNDPIWNILVIHIETRQPGNNTTNDHGVPQEIYLTGWINPGKSTFSPVLGTFGLNIEQTVIN